MNEPAVSDFIKTVAKETVCCVDRKVNHQNKLSNTRPIR